MEKAKESTCKLPRNNVASYGNAEQMIIVLCQAGDSIDQLFLPLNSRFICESFELGKTTWTAESMVPYQVVGIEGLQRYDYRVTSADDLDVWIDDRGETTLAHDTIDGYCCARW